MLGPHGACVGLCSDVGGAGGGRAGQIAVRYVSISAGRAGEAISNLLSIIFNIINPRHSIFHACAARPPSVRRVK